MPEGNEGNDSINLSAYNNSPSRSPEKKPDGMSEEQFAEYR